MSESLLQLRAELAGLKSRERRLLLTGAALRLLLGLLLGWSLVTLGVNFNWAHPSHAVFWVGIPLIATLFLALWSLRGWRATASLRRQAERVESLLPDLHGALVTVLDRWEQPASPALLERAARRAQAQLSQLSPAVVWPAGRLRSLRNALLLTVLLFLGFTAFLPTDPVSALRALFSVAPAAAQARIAQEGPSALVGDITLRYLYPTYTGLEPLEVANSNGEIHAPPGTKVEIKARSANRFDSAQLQIDKQEPFPAELQDGRQVSGSFEVKTSGVWRILFDGVLSPDYRIVVEPDLPPDVVVQATAKRFSVAADSPISALWRARDDYGLSRLVVQVKEKGKAAREVALAEPVGHPKEASDRLKLRPTDLGLAAGSSATIRVGAWDNDGVSGSKVGWSAPIELEVVGPEGNAPQLTQWRKDLRDALVDALAPFLMDEHPPFGKIAGADAWQVAARARYAQVDLLAVQRAGSPDGKVLAELFMKRSDFLGFVSSLALSSGGTIPEADAQELARMQDAHLGALEDTILYFDSLIQAEAMKSLVEILKQLRTEADELNAETATLSPPALQSRLDQLERLMQQAEAQAVNVQDRQAQEFLADRMRQVRALMNQTRKAAAANDMPKAREDMARVAQEIEDLVSGFEELQRRGRSKSRELGDAMKKLQEELSQLEHDQQSQQEKTDASRKKYGADMDRATRQWQELEQQAEQLADRTSELSQKNSQSNASGAVDHARADAKGLHDSVRARDLDVALQRAIDAENSLRSAENRAQLAQRFGEDTTALRQELAQARQQATRLREGLEQMDSQRTNTSPDLQRALQQQAAEQQELSERISQARQKAQEVSKQLPMRAPGLQEGMEQADQQSQRAADAMRQGDPTETEGGQQATQDGLRQAEQALKDARQRMSQLQQAQSGEGQGQKQEGDEGNGDNGNDADQQTYDLELPSPEQFQTPEEYRRALLEGMEGQVPEEYKALNRRYYEELVRQ